MSETLNSELSTKHPQQRHRERGNAFFIVMIGVVLFAGLMFTFSRGARQGGDNLSEKQAKIAAQEIMDYVQQMERAVNRLLIKGCSENDISFYLSDITELANYIHTPEAPDRCKVFHPEGGIISWREPNPDWLDTAQSAQTGYGEWYFTGRRVHDVGTDAAADLIVMIHYLNSNLCLELNRSLNIVSGPPVPVETANWGSDGTPYASGWYTGSFVSGWIDTTGQEIQGKHTACYEGEGAFSGQYFFYHVLIAR